MYNHDYTHICKIPASSHTFQIHRCCYLSYIRLCLKKRNAKGKPHVFAYHGALNTPYASVLPPPPHPLGFLNITDKSWNPNWWEVAIYRLLRTWRTKHKDVQWCQQSQRSAMLSDLRQKFPSSITRPFFVIIIIIILVDRCLCTSEVRAGNNTNGTGYISTYLTHQHT